MDVRLKYAGLVALLAMPLMGMSCSGMKYQGDASCESGGRGCTIHGEISGTLPIAGHGMVQDVLSAFGAAASASSYSIDVGDSTVTIPGTGLVKVSLIEGASGTVRASRTFPWIRQGTRVVFADPSAVDAWAIENGEAADTVDYDMNSFQTSQEPGWNTLAAALQYQGQTQSYATTTWHHQACPGDPLVTSGKRGQVRNCRQ